MKRKQPEPKPTAQEPTPSTEEEPVKESVWIYTETPLDGWTDARSMGLLDAPGGPTGTTDKAVRAFTKELLDRARSWQRAFSILRWYFCARLGADGGIIPYQNDPAESDCSHFVEALYGECDPNRLREKLENCPPWRYPLDAPLIPTYEEARRAYEKVERLPKPGTMRLRNELDIVYSKRFLSTAIVDYVWEFELEGLQFESESEALDGLRKLSDKGFIMTACGVQRLERISAPKESPKVFGLDLLAKIYGCIGILTRTVDSEAECFLDIRLPMNVYERWDCFHILNVVTKKYKVRNLDEHEAACKDILPPFKEIFGGTVKRTKRLERKCVGDAIAHLVSFVTGRKTVKRSGLSQRKTIVESIARSVPVACDEEEAPVGKEPTAKKKSRKNWEKHKKFSHRKPIVRDGNRIDFNGGRTLTVTTTAEDGTQESTKYAFSETCTAILDHFFDAFCRTGGDHTIEFLPDARRLFNTDEARDFMQKHLEAVKGDDKHYHGRYRFTFFKQSTDRKRNTKA